MKFIIETDDINEAYRALAAIGQPMPTSAPAPAGENTAPAPAADVDVEKPRRGRKPKDAPVETPAAAPAPVAAATPTPAPVSDWDDEPAAPAAVVYTKDDTRAALVSYQNRLTSATSGPELEAARATVLKLLADVGNGGQAVSLGALAPEKYAAVIAAANAAK